MAKTAEIDDGPQNGLCDDRLGDPHGWPKQYEVNGRGVLSCREQWAICPGHCRPWIVRIIKFLRDALVAWYALSPSLSIMASLVMYFVDNGTSDRLWRLGGNGKKREEGKGGEQKTNNSHVTL